MTKLGRNVTNKYGQVFSQVNCPFYHIFIYMIVCILDNMCRVVIEVFIIIIKQIKLSFSDTTVIEGGRERKHS